MSDPSVLTSVRGETGIIELNRPSKFNCLSSRLIAEIERALDACEKDVSIRAILIRANGKHFCTGADLEEVTEARKDRATLAAFLSSGHRLLRRLEASSLPIVAEVQGLCLAGGLELAMACDIVFAARSARFGCQHAKYGLVPGFGGTQRLAALTGLRCALDLMFSARWISAEEAQFRGLISHVVDEGNLSAEVDAYCSQLARRNPKGIALMKQLGRSGFAGTIDAGLENERTNAVDVLMSANVTEGLSAFRESREPLFG